MTQRSIEAEIGLCILFSAVDGEISEKEIGALSDRVGHLLGDDFDVMRLPALLDAELGSISENGVDEYVAKLPARIPSERRFEAVRAACAVACADGLAPEEEEVVRQVCGVLDVDADDVMTAVGARNDTIAAAGDAHDDEPNAATKLIAEHFVGHGWVDPMQSLRDAGIGVSGFGALALQYPSPSGHLLRVEHHTCDGSIHFHVTDDEDSGSDLVLFPDGREQDVVSMISSMQDEVTLDNLEQYIPKLQDVARVCLFQGEGLVEIAKPS
ncbi:MAG: hypothetical protein JWO86_6755 [Myxococcaceae bacterium]|jgi:uncharacterized tellurite resistance protein B-like protein|nr:hypothetical protein [Myxococcaceae bacterium]MEA2747830.1 hypothetical protein [Myxococcales bacterium]